MSNRVRPGRRVITRRKYLEARLVREQKATIFDAKAAVAAMEADHPELNFDEERSPKEWGVLNG